MKSFNQVAPKQIIADFIIIFSNMDLTSINWCFRRSCDYLFRSSFMNEGHIPPAAGSPSHQKRECAQVTTPPWGSPYPVTASCGHSNQREKSLKSRPLMTTLKGHPILRMPMGQLRLGGKPAAQLLWGGSENTRPSTM